LLTLFRNWHWHLNILVLSTKVLKVLLLQFEIFTNSQFIGSFINESDELGTFNAPVHINTYGNNLGTAASKVNKRLQIALLMILKMP
jgi:hypothetical protein